MVGVRHHRPQRDVAGTGGNGGAHEFQRSLVVVEAAVFQEDLHLHLAVDGLQRATVDGLAQRQQLGAGLRHIHVDGVELLDGGQCRVLAGRDQCPRRIGGGADTAGNGRLDARIVQIDLRRLQRSLGGHHGGPVLLQGGFGIVHVLFAHRVDGQQITVALRLRFGRAYHGLRLNERCLRIVVGCLVAGGIQLVEHLTFLHLLAFGEQPLLDDATHLGPNLGAHVRHRPASQRLFHRQALRDDGLHHHGGFLWRRRGRPGLLATGKRQRNGGGNQQVGTGQGANRPACAGCCTTRHASVSSWPGHGSRTSGHAGIS